MKRTATVLLIVGIAILIVLGFYALPASGSQIIWNYPIGDCQMSEAWPYALYCENADGSLRWFANPQECDVVELRDYAAICIGSLSTPTPEPSPTPQPECFDIYLVDAVRDETVMPMTSGMNLSLENPGNYSVAVFACEVDRVRFDWAEGRDRTESASPYSLCGDTNGDYYRNCLFEGSHNILIKGTQGGQEVISYQLVFSVEGE